jgi:2-alkenal reductase
MIKNINRRILLLAIITILLLSACSLASDNPTSIPVATVDTGEIADIVLAEVEDRLATRAGDQPAVAEDEPVVDPDAIAEFVLAEVQEQLVEQKEQEEQVAVAFESEVAALTADSLQTNLVELYQRANPSVVFIIVPPIGSGSGFVFNDEGYIVTNNHVVDNGRRFEVVFAGGDRQEAELIGTDVDSDLAVIKVEQLPAGIEPLPLGSSDEVAVGQFVVAIGNPFGEQGSMSLGIVSGLNRSLQSDRESGSGSSYSLPKVIQTDAPINPGNSGGPLLNLEGELVGVNSAIRTTTGTNSGVGFSIPVDAVSRIVPGLIANGSYDYPYLGAAFDGEISLDDLDTYGLSQTQGAYILSTTVDGPAEEAGLIPANSNTGRGGDLIVAMDEQTISDFSDLNSYLVFHTAAGDTIQITVLRDGQLLDLPLTLGARP